MRNVQKRGGELHLGLIDAKRLRAARIAFGLLWTTLLAVASIFTLPAAASGEVAVADEYKEVATRLEKFIAAERKAKDLPATSIALVDNNRIVWSMGFGSQDAAGRRPASSGTVYRVGSVSKLFTDMAVMQLVANGSVDLDAPVKKYLPDFSPENPFDVDPTVRQLMNHQSGLVRETPVGSYFDDSEPSIADTVRSLNQTKLVHQPGTITKYSNAAVTVAGYIVEKVSKQPYEEYMQKNLLGPMQMNSSAFRRNDEVNEKLADAWMWARHLPRFAAPTFELGTLPAGNLYSTVDDLGNFLITIFNDGKFNDQQIIPAHALDAMLERRKSESGAPLDYGVGFRLGELDGHRTLGHGGAVYGFATQVTGIPEEKLGVAAVVAVDCGNGFTRRLSDYALRLMLAQRAGKPLPDVEITEPLPPGVANKLAGIYEAEGKQIRLEALYDKLYLNYDNGSREVRTIDDDLTVDDVFGFGPTVKPSEDYASLTIGDKTYKREPSKRPAACPEKYRGLIGEYGWDHNILYIYEQAGQLWALIEWFDYYPLTEVAENVFAFPDLGLYPGEKIEFLCDESGNAGTALAAGVKFPRRDFGSFENGVFRVRPTRPVAELQAEALAAASPSEARPFRKPDLVDVTAVDPSLALDIRYASTDNFLQSKIYDSPQAFLQRPAAEALARVQQSLKSQGYGLLVHDAYRPWYVTKLFWDATPRHLHAFVADPSQGSRHNRGCAVDLTLVDLTSGEPVEMVGVYDEMSHRSYPLYPGGESRQRWHRDLLRRAMEREGFSVYEVEWWHFDYKDWRQYPIVNQRFDELAPAEKPAG